VSNAPVVLHLKKDFMVAASAEAAPEAQTARQGSI